MEIRIIDFEIRHYLSVLENLLTYLIAQNDIRNKEQITATSKALNHRCRKPNPFISVFMKNETSKTPEPALCFCISVGGSLIKIIMGTGWKGPVLAARALRSLSIHRERFCYAQWWLVSVVDFSIISRCKRHNAVFHCRRMGNELPRRIKKNTLKALKPLFKYHSIIITNYRQIVSRHVHRN